MSNGIRLEGDWSKLKSSLKSLSRVNFTALHKEIGEHIVSTTQERFKTGTGPDGRKWEESIRALEEGGATLRDTSRLRNSITSRARLDRVVVGTNDKRARIHQYGGVIKAKKAKALKFKMGKSFVVKKQVTIPARPFLGLDEEDEKAIRGIIADHLRGCLK